MYLKIRILITILFFSGIVFSQNKNSQVYATLSISSADSLIQANYMNPDFIILDVRTIGEYDTKHIENGVEFDYYQSDFNTYLDTLIKTKIYLVHCASGGRSGTVFSSMQSMGFTEFYNLSGGLNAWESAGKPTITSVAPILLSVSDTLVHFTNSELNQEDTISVTITNYGNDTLKFTNYSDISSTEFSTDFNISRTLTGLMDYTFNFYYNPIDLLSDSIIFNIESNGLDLSFILKGNALVTNVAITNNTEIQIYPNPVKDIFYVKGADINHVEIVNIKGQIIYSKNCSQYKHAIDLSNFDEGIYFVKLTSKKEIIVRKILKL